MDAIGTGKNRKNAWGLWLAWIAAIVLAAGLFAGSSAQFLHKVSRQSTAYERWRGDVVRLWDRPSELGSFPYPTIAALLMLPTASMSAMSGGIWWQVAKGVSLAATLYFCLGLAGGSKPWRELGVVALLMLLAGARYITADLTHGNINLFVAVLAIGGIYAFVRGYDIAAGLLLALGTAIKVTPGLLIIYFAYKRQWKLTAWAAVGLVVFLVVVPVAAQGPAAARGQFANWWDQYVSPYLLHGEVFNTQINQSLPGVLYRLTVPSPAIERSGAAVNLLNLTHEQACRLIRLANAVVVLGMGYLFRKKITQRASLGQVAEYALVLLGMLMLSERTWKAHCVLVLLPGAVLSAALWAEGFSRSARWWMAGLLGIALAISLLTATDLIGPVPADYAEAYGAVLIANILLAAGLTIFISKSKEQESKLQGKV